MKKSIFISYVTPINEFETFRAKLKIEHPKATHIVWVYRYINEFDQIVENGSDDGEPKGTSAQPTLNVLRGLSGVNLSVLTIRYFGGIKLGTGGLVRAYGTAAKMVLEKADFIPYEKRENFCFTCKYHFVQRAEYFLNKIGVDFKNRDFETDEVIWRLKVNINQKEEIARFLSENFV
ncbi:MAG: IMPACT family protein [Campylobacteraceae bacterium]|nr:IMPACT family protein [Campylobacteraceae bacterium]